MSDDIKLQAGGVSSLKIALDEAGIRRIQWCRARALHALDSMRAQGVLREVLDEIFSYAESDEIFDLVCDYLHENGWGASQTKEENQRAVSSVLDAIFMPLSMRVLNISLCQCGHPEHEHAPEVPVPGAKKACRECGCECFALDLSGDGL